MGEEQLLPDAEVVSVIYHNKENGYAIVRVRAKDEPGQVTITGTLGELAGGSCLNLRGRWINHPKFGRQFEVSTFEESRPATENGVIRFLQSSIKGVGEKTATLIVEEFGIGVLDILDDDPERLLKIKGISKKKLKDIIESWGRQREIKNLLVFLQTHQVPTTFAGKIFHLYGAQAERKLRENPYDLAYEIRGVGFKTADNMAMKLGFAPDCSQRLEAAIAYTMLTSCERNGHLFLPKPKLLEEVARMLDTTDFEKLELALYALEDKKRVRIEDLSEQGISEAVYLMYFFHFENETTQRLYQLISHPTPVSRKKIDKTLPKVEEKLGFALSDEQREAVFEACSNKVFIITGGPGTGKTTITKAILLTLKELGLKIKLAAPTGRAAKRMSEATGHPAKTVHRLLQFQPEGGFHYCEDQKLKADVLVVDEASMVDAQLFVSILRALPHTCRLILVGDVNQLPSVGPGNVLGDLIDSKRVPCSVLTHIFRQAQESFIVVNAHLINAGQMVRQHPCQAPEADFFWIPQEDPAKVQRLILDSVCERIPERYGLDPLRDIQVLTPMHKGDVGTQALNTALQARLNPPMPGKHEIKRKFATFREGDRVIQLKNNYDKEVFNGDLGWILEVDPEDQELLIEFDGNQVHFETSDMDELGLAYAVSVHKSQGSEYPAVVMPIVTQHYMLLQRNLLYTGLTRARELAVLIGSDRAFQIGLNNATAGNRNTHLAHRLRAIFAENRLC
ncbi:MAG: ATP-dependent RecD-like DNA helicase [Pseudodesulfovibrio sp.]|jgi:exodeoxyribonuclease V alpha subunit|uniref:Exodeoxyribonuclease V alpha subunit n=1 Tax=Pseudodesulfovibrio indicus TaxID=1716143 RepID=A0A126QPK6_9BACT|nr:ATP-dependent RecD-like DNA helicase [Pseudodesulfovibrio indicus]AMK11696.1 heavy metal transporter [Pseudodesulfovibrio indicus]TDT88225.1 exodeoxyribonuclease V alpha subunit [Pseudodesulfovibrio indicus]